MGRLAPRLDILRALFARSGNQCAFPGCEQVLINNKNQFVGQICHIEAASPGGERFNSGQSDEERRGYDNLLLLCYPHHIETNDTSEYTLEILKKIKQEHEEKYEKNQFLLEESVLTKIADEMQTFWGKIDALNKIEHSMKEFAVDINAKGSFFDVLKGCRKNIEYLQQFFDIFRNSETSIVGNWEYHHIGVPNRMNRLKIDLMHLELKYLEEHLKIQGNDSIARERLDLLKEEFKIVAQHSTIID